MGGGRKKSENMLQTYWQILKSKKSGKKIIYNWNRAKITPSQQNNLSCALIPDRTLKIFFTFLILFHDPLRKPIHDDEKNDQQYLSHRLIHDNWTLIILPQQPPLAIVDPLRYSFHNAGLMVISLHYSWPPCSSASRWNSTFVYSWCHPYWNWFRLKPKWKRLPE